MFDEDKIREAVTTVVDSRTADLVIAELNKPDPSPFVDGQVVVTTSTGRLVRWKPGMDWKGMRALNQTEIG